jgi:branched-chain amino acid transport system ATP-binding protein
LAAPTVLALEKLEVVYGKVITAVQGVTLEVRAGQIVALLGTNGAGKTTTLRAISGFIGLDDAAVTEGRVLHLGEPIQNQPPHRIARRGIALVPERNKIFESLTVAENLEVTHAGAKDQAGALERVYGYFPHLAERRARQAGYLSGGERQMLTIGAALMCLPDLLLVDELSLGLAPRLVEELLGRLQAIRADLGITILLVEQNATAALAVADYGYIIEGGRIVLDGDAQRLLGHADVQEFYLGTGGGATRRSYRDVKQYRRSRRWYG